MGLLAVASDLHALEPAVKLDIDVEVPGILVEVKKRPRPQREVTALAFAQLGDLAQLRQQGLYAVKVFLCCMPHSPSMTLNAKATQERTCTGPSMTG
jgi:hypothetical protein